MNKVRKTAVVFLLLGVNVLTVTDGYALTDRADDGQRERAYLVQSLTRIADPVLNALSKNELKKQLPVAAKSEERNVIAALKSSRIITPSYSNWLLFSAEIEAALLKFDGKCDRMRVDYAIKSHMNWYKGDGAYGDGPNFHWDYYNSFVIQPMLLDVTQTLLAADKSAPAKRTHDLVLKRSQRYAEVLERLISPEGTYPPIGRSLAYRFGAFQSLSQIAFMKALPADVSPQQVRAALYTMIKRQIEAPGTFDKNGWLQIDLYGHQPGIGEFYISTGSLYLCSEAFLVLGLNPSDTFWTGDDKDWTAKKIWNGQDMPTDHSVD